MRSWGRAFRINSSMASIFTVWRAMMSCICAFSASSCFKLARPLDLIPAYFESPKTNGVGVNGVTPSKLFGERVGMLFAQDHDHLRSENRLLRIVGFLHAQLGEVPQVPLAPDRGPILLEIIHGRIFPIDVSAITCDATEKAPVKPAPFPCCTPREGHCC